MDRQSVNTAMRSAWMPLIVALVVPGLGMLYQIGQRDADNRATQARVGELEKRVLVASDAAANATIRVDQLEARAKATEATLHDIAEQLRRMDGNLIALCAATHGAQCVR